MYRLDGDFQFVPPDRARMWKNLALTMSQASALTGVSERQIQHWMDRGYINPAMPGTRKLSGESVDTIVLILQARGAGIPLRRAVVLAREYLREEESGALGLSVSPPALHKLREELTSARAGLEAIERIVEGLDPRVAGAQARLPFPPLE